MITKLVLTVPAAAFSLLTLAAGAVATSDSAEARQAGTLLPRAVPRRAADCTQAGSAKSTVEVTRLRFPAVVISRQPPS